MGSEISVVRGVLASALGAATGTVLALALGHFWLIGAFVGGIVGYLSYHVEQVVAIAPRVWKATTAVRISSPYSLLPSRESLVCVGWSFLAFTMIGQTLMWPATLMSVGVHWLLNADMTNLQWGAVLWCLVGMPLSMGVGGVLIDLFFGIGGPRYRAKSSRDSASRYNIVSATILVGTVSYQAVSKFLPQLLREVYSEPRLIAGASALMGAVVGWQAHSWPVGALTAGSLYLAQHQLIHKRLKFAKTK